jgi:hypothetical protein
MRKRALLMCLLAAASVFLILAFTHAQITDPLTLDERAKLSPSGQYVTLMPAGDEPAYPDLETLTHLSTDIVVATAGANVCKLTPGKDLITTNYTVTVQEVLTGKLPVNGVVTVSLPGGRAVFPGVGDSGPPLVGDIRAKPTSAEVRTPWFKKMEAGKQYYLFLTGSGALNQKYHISGYLETTGGPQGVFEVSGGVVKSNSGRLRDPIWRYHNMAATTFKTTVLNAVLAEPGSSCAICP